MAITSNWTKLTAVLLTYMQKDFVYSLETYGNGLKKKAKLQEGKLVF